MTLVGVVEPTPGDLEVHQRDRAPEHVGHVTRGAQSFRRACVRLVSGVQVATSPEREPQEGGCRRGGEQVAVGRASERILGVVAGAVQVPGHQRQSGSPATEQPLLHASASSS